MILVTYKFEWNIIFVVVQRLIRIVFLSIALIYIGGMCYQVGYFAYFKANQDAIAEKYCVNKAKPEMHCNGHCHLQKELKNTQIFAEDDERNESNEQLPQLELNFLVAIFPEIPSWSDSLSARFLELAWGPEEDVQHVDNGSYWHPPRV
ncbi:hypothetical protein [Parvicella tangerina]|uniref:Uncharacterized protein n=1 Tax=Parvicella tangerina TaxID=2829795 RepID=A0A916JKD2_9FLAO|nr:hypothetical protein [Parvicella tangerina]CAG5078742.1 hypothetical protein CRYO30217_00755 [Parvicella tangerina]